MEKYLEAGKIVGTHALKGEVRAEIYCNSVQQFCSLKRLYFDKGAREIAVKSRPQKNIAIVKIKGVDSVSAADALRGRLLYLDREDLSLDEGEFFICDIVGLEVIDADSGRRYGEIASVFNTGANDIYEMKTDGGKNIYIPVIDEIVIRIDIEAKAVLIRPMKGLFDNED